MRVYELVVSATFLRFAVTFIATPMSASSMYKLRDIHFHRAKYLFDNDYPNLPLVHGVIEGVLPGDVYADSEYLPTRCLVVTNAAYAFSIGLRQPDDIRHALDILGGREEIKLVIPELSVDDAARYGLAPVARRQYQYIGACPQDVENTSGYQVLPVESTLLFRQCQWSGFMASIFGSEANFMERASALVLFDQDSNAIVSEAFAIRSRGFAEIAAVTNPIYQGRGLSTLLCGQLVQWMMDRDLQPIWSCDETNAASWRVAEKLGMDLSLTYTFFRHALHFANAQ
ncbi:GNAT family N-acetyltransferase [Burkholderia lata]|uniref:GNAT family N-acetyltransferase n=1 Tax=Burkholderia lata (strain ATCC 17760 / DSM 23089 / LMG 22485 / NCIMB 9086 / R18194 / 383) TaxID=482957 RepID=UPI0015821BBE|nr:GNAT family N-acetyltransferase [Burkholderia lata]